MLMILFYFVLDLISMKYSIKRNFHVDLIHGWSFSNKLTVSASKSKTMSVARRQVEKYATTSPYFYW